jgi:DMSO/TMAO reductase YedYZ molybdopterin-dependent catalytic subunit
MTERATVLPLVPSSSCAEYKPGSANWIRHPGRGNGLRANLGGMQPLATSSRRTKPANAREVKLARRTSSVGLIIREKEPHNLETPFAEVDSFLTPTELFYIRSHFTTPALDIGSYQLRIDGAVRSPFSLSYSELRAMPSETRVATLECAGNGRVFLVPQVEGAQWELGAVGNAEWTGVPFRALLDRAGIEDSACEIVLEGADRACSWPLWNGFS